MKLARIKRIFGSDLVGGLMGDFLKLYFSEFLNSAFAVFRDFLA